MNKKALLLALTVVLVGLFFWFQRTRSKPQDSTKVITVAALLPLTGPSADIGKWQQKGLMLAEDSLNGDGKSGPKVKVVYEDTAGDVKTGLSAFEKAASSAETSAYVIALSSIANAVAPRVSATPKPCLLLAVSLPNITDRSDNYFRFNLGSEQEAEVMAAHLKKTGVKRVAVLHLNDEFGVGALVVFSAKYVDAGDSIVFSEPYEKEQTDFRTTLLKLSEQKPDGVYVIGYLKSSVLLIKQLRELGIQSPVFGNMALSVPSFLSLGGEALSGAVFTVTDFRADSAEPSTAAFVKTYQAKNGESPTFFAAFAHDSLLAIHHAAKSDRPIREALASLPAFSGALDAVSFDQARNLKVKVRLLRNDGGKLVEVN